MKRLAYIWLLTIASCYPNEELPDDQKVWEYGKPADVGMSNEMLFDLHQRIAEGDFEDIKSLTIIKQDKIVFENYYDNSFRTAIRPTGLVSQIVTIAALGQVVADGYIKSLDDPILLYMPKYSNIFDAQPEKKAITIRDVLHNKSGLVWFESAIQGGSADFSRMKNTTDWPGYVIKQDMEAPPDVRLVVNSGGANLLTSIMQYALGEIDLEKYIDEHILKPIGIKNYRWEYDPSGNLDGASGLFLRDIDFTRLGYLFLNYGLWQRRRVIDEDWSYEMLFPRSEAARYYDLCYGWRSFSEGYADFFGFERGDIFFTPLDHGQVLFLVPEENMIVSIYAENYFYGFGNPSLQIFLNLFASIEN
ncbi:MAG: serine hydrolase [Cyclobacteriaceae bacterium]